MKKSNCVLAIAIVLAFASAGTLWQEHPRGKPPKSCDEGKPETRSLTATRESLLAWVVPQFEFS
jgi:hypothetical protein